VAAPPDFFVILDAARGEDGTLSSPFPDKSWQGLTSRDIVSGASSLKTSDGKERIMSSNMTRRPATKVILVSTLSLLAPIAAITVDAQPASDASVILVHQGKLYIVPDLRLREAALSHEMMLPPAANDRQ
jgi:hypothetical protein